MYKNKCSGGETNFTGSVDDKITNKREGVIDIITNKHGNSLGDIKELILNFSFFRSEKFNVIVTYLGEIKLALGICNFRLILADVLSLKIRIYSKTKHSMNKHNYFPTYPSFLDFRWMV